MRKPFFLALALNLFAIPANAAVINQFKVADWEIGAYTNDQSGRFSHCAAAGRYKNGITLLFSVTESLEWAVGFSSPEWNLRQGRPFDVEFRIDGGKLHTVNGRAVSNRLVRATLPDNAELFNQFRYGNQLVARIEGNPEARFNLSNTAAMLTEVLNCAKKYKGHVANNANPKANPNSSPRAQERDTGSHDRPRQNPNSGTGSSSGNNSDDTRNTRLRDREDDMPNRFNQDQQPQQQQTPANVGPTEETRAEAVELATNILRRANIPDFQIQKPDQLSANFRDKYDAVWKAEGITGTLRVLAGPRANTVERIRTDVVASDVAACKGRFATGVVPAASGSQAATIQTSCDADPAWAVYYIAVPRRKGGAYLLGIFGTGEAAARLQSVTNAYRLVALEVLER
jgi:hypothetical protein